VRPPQIRASYGLPGELVVDNFAGGGGASCGIEAALGRPVDIAINHSAEAIAMHRANHPETRHYCEDIWTVDPREACGSRPVGLVWFSPDCTHFSRAKGSVPRRKDIRGLAWVVVKWARQMRPRVLVVENVEEFQTWGPLDDNGYPDPAKAGSTFRLWLNQLVGLGYTVDFRSLVAADYGTPTTRKRLFLVARRDGAGIAWPEPNHGAGRPEVWHPAAEVIDWSLSCPSIFDRARPLAEATLRRIAAGVRRYVLEASQPFIVPITHHGDPNRGRGVDAPLATVTAAHRGEFALVAPTLVTTGYGERDGQEPRVPGLDKPLGTVVAGGQKHALVAALLARHFGGVVGRQLGLPVPTVTAKDHHSLVEVSLLTKFYKTATGADVREPMPTVTAGAGGGHLAEVRAFLVGYYSNGGGQQQGLFDPLHTVTSKARFGLVTIAGVDYQIADIGMRMLQPHELFAAQGFPDDYEIAPDFNGKPMTKTAQIALCGNAVCPQVAEAIVASNTRGVLAAAG
jgi:DNA (cytosine-5)-methyltransferase 1